MSPPSRRVHRTPGIYCTLAATALGIVSVAGCERESPEPVEMIRPVRAIRVGDAEPLASRSFPGRAEADREVNLAFRVSGPLIVFPAKVGDELKEGDLVARIDPRDFESDVRNAEGSLRRAKAQLEQANADLQRNLNIQRENAGAIAQATIDESREAVGVAEADIVALEATLKTAQDALVDTRLLAPFAGTVVATYADNFESVEAGSAIIRLLDTERIEFVINLPESLISVATDVTNVRVEFDAYPGIEIPAGIAEIGTEASDTTRTYPVKLVMDQPDGVTILPGMAGRASADPVLDGTSFGSDLVVPATALASSAEGGEASVWIVDPDSNTVALRPVTVRGLGSTGYIISDGIERGEIVVTAGVSFLRDGLPVTPQLQ